MKRLCHLYRQVAIDLSQARAAGDDPSVLLYLNSLAARAHGQVYAAKRVSIRPLFEFITGGFARALRRNWVAVSAAAAVFLLTTLASWLAVVRNPELAYSLFDEKIVEYENIRLEKQQGEYRGNFTFKVSESPLVAAQIIGNNVRVAIFGFALGAAGCVLGLFLLIYNGRMLGTLSGLVWNGGYFLGFYSLIMTHGVLELSAICIAAAGGLRLGWAFFAPGRLTRGEAYRAAAGDAFALLGGAILMLLVAGIIEAFVTPHFDATVRWSVAIGTGVLFALYVAFAGRGHPDAPSAVAMAS
ncbi:MAG: stage II sporulation protein M [Gemmataceae bacterium]